MNLTCFKVSLNFVKLSLCALCSSLLVDVCELNRACCDCTCPVSVDSCAVLNALDDVFEIGKGTEARNKNPLNRLVGDFGIADEIKGAVTNIEEGAKKSGNKWLKIAVPVALALGGVAAYLGLRGGKNAKNIQKPQPQPNVIPQEQVGKIEEKPQEINPEKPQEIIEENIQESVAEMPQNIIAEKTINITTADFDFRPSIDKEEEMPRLYRVG